MKHETSELMSLTVMEVHGLCSTLMHMTCLSNSSHYNNASPLTYTAEVRLRRGCGFKPEGGACILGYKLSLRISNISIMAPVQKTEMCVCVSQYLR